MSFRNLIIGFSVLFFAVSLLFINLGKYKQASQFNSTSPISTTPSLVPVKSDSGVPLLTEQDVIRIFFELINEKRIPEAISMMSIDAVPDEAAKQAWGVQFNAFTAVKLNKLEVYQKEMWTKNIHTYKATLEVSMSKDSINAPIPYYGFDTNPNIRWISLEKDSKEMWKINGISTGP